MISFSAEQGQVEGGGAAHPYYSLFREQWKQLSLTSSVLMNPSEELWPHYVLSVTRGVLIGSLHKNHMV